MWPQPFNPQRPQDDMSRLTEENNTLRLQVNNLNGQVHTLRRQVNNLMLENARLRALLPHEPPLPSENRMFTAPNDNVLHLPVVIESLAVMRDHFQRQGTLKQWLVKFRALRST
jgi:regulator of replication initiation timing